VTESTSSTPGRNVHSVWRCKWCGLEYRHPIMGAVAVGHWCGDELRTMTRTVRSAYDEIGADERKQRRQRTFSRESTLSQQGFENVDGRNEGRDEAEWGQTPGSQVAALLGAPSEGGVA
jgi:hypothetical protein